MDDLGSVVDGVAAETLFSGVVRIDRGGTVALTKAYGLADRRLGIPVTADTQFAIASGTKGLTALTVVSLIESGHLDLATRARTLLDDDVPLVGDDVTVEHLLAHRSGIGDYLDEDTDVDLEAYLMPVPVQDLATTEQYVRVLDGHPQKFPAGRRFSYSNSGYVLLALLIERACGTAFQDMVQLRVCRPAGMPATAFLRSDELPGEAAFGYLSAHGARTNIFHLPVRGNGDGGVYTTIADISALWTAFFDGRIVSREWVERMTEPRSDVLPASKRYGLGFWLDADGPGVQLEGMDAGVSFGSRHDPTSGDTCTVIANTTNGASPMWRALVAAGAV